MTATSTTTAPRIAVALVEDDDGLRRMLVAGLGKRGFDIRGFPAAEALYQGLTERPCDILVLDIGLPGEDGFGILEHMRTTSRIGIIMLTARGAIPDRVRALQGGADVYLVKPVNIPELAANITSLARRLPMSAESTPSPPSTGGWRLADRQLLTSDGIPVALTATEHAFLESLLASNAQVSRDALATVLWGTAGMAHGNRLDMLASRLRRKVFLAVGRDLPLRTIRGAGFAFIADT